MSGPYELSESASLFADAWNRHDAAALASLFTDDAHFVNVVGIGWRSRAEIEDAHVQTHATIFKDSHLAVREVETTRLGPGAAAQHVSWELTGMRSPDGRSLPMRRGILLFVLIESGDGWLIKVAQNTDIISGAMAPPVTV